MSIFEKFKKNSCEFILNKPKKALGLFAILFFIISPFLITIIPDFSSRVWYSEKDPLLQRYDYFEETFGNDDSAIIVVKSKDPTKDIFDPVILKHIFDITQESWKVADVQRVESLTNYDFVSSTNDEINVLPIAEDRKNIDTLSMKKTRELVFKDKFVSGFLVSNDAKLALIHVQMTPSTQNKMNYEKIYNGVKEITAKYKNSEIEVYISGTASLIQNIQNITIKDISTLFPLLLAFITFLLWFLYRKKSSIFIAYSVVFTSILLMLGVQGILGFSFNIVSSICSQILLTVALADIIHLLSHIKFSESKGIGKIKSLEHSIYNNFYPTFLTSFSTAIGFSAFATAKAQPIAELGIVVAFGVCFAWISTYFLAAPLLVLVTRKEVESKTTSSSEEATELAISQRTSASVKWINKFKYLIIILFVAALALGGNSLFKLVVDLDPSAQLPTWVPYRVAQKELDKSFDNIIPIEIMIHSDGYENAKDPEFLKKVETFNNELLTKKIVGKVNSILDILRNLNRTFNNDKEEFYKLPKTKEKVGNLLLFYSMGLPEGRSMTNKISHDQKIIRVTGFWNSMRSSDCLIAIDKIHAIAKRLNINAKVTGKTPMFHELTPYVVNTFFVSFSASFFLIALLMIFVLKDFKLGLLSLLPNIVPISIGIIIYFLRSKTVDMTTVLIASVCFGIAVDDTIHFLFDYKRRKMEGSNTVEAIEKIFTLTLPSLFYTTLIIICGFSSFLLANYAPNQDFGLMVTVILAFALLTDALLLPALLLAWDRD
jgi:predicted RND superfamily exporter protein